ncbi:unnamed protein product [Cylindrotheca closterium]|uniref:Uncharacterized protein n=1 Tax=Cylindrotheca closterium TaxID=2856 RepID=A0AAD2CXY5_9STRA|nr:unnamed protein product [Cylindrotheca closterium]
MGGDDLGSEDEFLTAPLRAEDASDDDTSLSDDSSAESNNQASKRSLVETKETGATPSKKQKREARALGDGVRDKSANEQAIELAKFAGMKVHAGQIAISDNRNSPSLMKRIQGIISKKKLKKHNKKGSPLVVVISISARRAVAVLKELSPFNVRVAKLFPKQGSIEEQATQMQSGSMAMAVCTPHRLLALVKEGAMGFGATELLVIDTFADKKRFTVASLPDTAPSLAELLKEAMKEERKNQRPLRVALL